MENKIVTVDEFLSQIASKSFWETYSGVKEELNDKIIEFTKLHVEAALESASWTLECYPSEREEIRQSYPLDNIK